jgi:hypothetical protein
MLSYRTNILLIFKPSIFVFNRTRRHVELYEYVKLD